MSQPRKPDHQQPTSKRRFASTNSPKSTKKADSQRNSTQSGSQPSGAEITPRLEEFSPPKLDYVLVAEISSTFGLRGALKASILTDFPNRFERLEEVFLAPPGAALDAPRTPYKVMSAKLQNDLVVLRLEGINKIEQAQLLRGYSVAVPMQEVVPLPEGEYYIFQIIGLEVYTVAGEFVGKVVNVESRTANDIYVVRGPMAKRDVLLPAIKDVVKSIDLEKGRITVELLDGLLEL